MNTVINVEHLSKAYRLGQIGTGTLSHDLNVWWAKVRGKPNPLLRIDEADPGNRIDGTIWALNDVNFTVEKGEVLGIIGKNGAGKSTLLKILSCVTAPTSGKVKIKGRIASLLEVGTGFHPELTGRENIYLNGAILGMNRKEIDRKFDEIVDFSGVEKFIETPVKRYSSGMYVRLAFAVAAHLDPEILLVDEVLAVGDADFQNRCLGKMGEAAKGGRTIMFVSHNMIAIRSLCKRIILLDNGSIVKEGEIEGVVDDYLRRGSSQILVKQWDEFGNAPGNEMVRLHHISISRLDQKFNDLITVETPLQMKAAFWNLLPGAVLNFSVVLYTLNGTPILNTTSEGYSLSEGLIWGSFVIPGNFLNDGVYTVRLLVVKDRSTVLMDIFDLLTFEIHEGERSGQWFGKVIGAVRPKFDWVLRMGD